MPSQLKQSLIPTQLAADWLIRLANRAREEGKEELAMRIFDWGFGMGLIVGWYLAEEKAKRAYSF